MSRLNDYLDGAASVGDLFGVGVRPRRPAGDADAAVARAMRHCRRRITRSFAHAFRVVDSGLAAGQRAEVDGANGRSAVGTRDDERRDRDQMVMPFAREAGDLDDREDEPRRGR